MYREVPYSRARGAHIGSFTVPAQLWDLWPLDPGPRGIKLNRHQSLEDAGGVAPARWKFDETDWWPEEHGLIMEQPTVPLTPGKYLVTGPAR